MSLPDDKRWRETADLATRMQHPDEYWCVAASRGRQVMSGNGSLRLAWGQSEVLPRRCTPAWGRRQHRNGSHCAVMENAPFMGDSRNVVNSKIATAEKASHAQRVGWVGRERNPSHACGAFQPFFAWAGSFNRFLPVNNG
jgi:hypothetical protein